MKVKSEKQLRKERQFIRNQREDEKLKGQDVIVCYYGNERCTIGQHEEFDTCRDFIIWSIVQEPDVAAKDMGFDSTTEMYAWMFENGSDDQEMKELVMDQYNGKDMQDEQ